MGKNLTKELAMNRYSIKQKEMSKGKMINLQKVYQTDSAIGRLYGVSRQRIQQLRKSLGVPMCFDRFGERDAEILKLYKEQGNVNMICNYFNLSMSQAYRVVHKQEKIEAREPLPDDSLNTVQHSLDSATAV